MTSSDPTPDPWAPWLDRSAWARWLDGGRDLGWAAWLADVATGWAPPAPPLPTLDDPDERAARRAAESLADGAWPSAVERLVRHTEGRSPWAILFLHGFGATRAGGEAVVDRFAREIGANTYYALLPGHGRTPEAHAQAPAAAYLAIAVESLAITRALGDRVMIIGSSTGGLIATWLAASFPDAVDAVVLASPFFDYADPSGSVLGLPFAIDAIEATWGPTRDATFGPDPNRRCVEGYEKNWLTEQRYRALLHLERLRGWLSQSSVHEAVTCPVLMLYTPNDQTADIEAMHRAFVSLGSHPASRYAAVVDGHHILLSAFVRTDKVRILAELRAFLADIDPSDDRAEPDAARET